MSIVLEGTQTLADLLHELGDIPAERVRRYPPPGTATERDVIRIHSKEKRLFELVDGVLVEKATGFSESRIAAVLIYFIERFLEENDLGIVVGADGMMRLPQAWFAYPMFLSSPGSGGQAGESRSSQFLRLSQTLPSSVSNTEAEIMRKLREYFAAGVRLAWVIDPKTRTARVYTSLKRVKIIPTDGVLEGGKVLPGFRLTLRELFERAERGADGKNQSK
jgi:Uma2 family endonuclease